MTGKKITNLDYLKDITEGEPAILKEFIQIFFEQLPEFREGLVNALKDKNWTELGQIAHKAKSSILTFGMQELGLKLKELQVKTQKLEDIDSYPAYVEDFLYSTDKATIELQEILKKL